MSDSVRPRRRQPTRLLRPWDFPGKDTGVGCRFLLQCMKVKSESEATQSYLTLSDPMDCSLPGSSVHGIFQARVLEWSAIAFSDRSGQAGEKSRLPNLSLGDGRGLSGRITSLPLTRKFQTDQLRSHSCGRLKLQFGLVLSFGLVRSA